MYELIEHKKLDAAAASITFSNIPQIYTDLVILLSARSSRSAINDYVAMKFNDSTSNYSSRMLVGNGASASSGTDVSLFAPRLTGDFPAATSTASTFGSMQIYIPNYRSGAAKSASIDAVTENNATTAFQELTAFLWNDTAAINSITLEALAGGTNNFVQHSSATLYGINRTQAIGKPKAIGGNITYANGHWVHTFTGSGTFYAQEDLEVEALVVAGGGGGGSQFAGAGGGGGFRVASNILLTSNASYPVLVGAGGAGGPAYQNGFKGENSTFSSITSTGGGFGASWRQTGLLAGGPGGSGGGGTANATGGAGNEGAFSPVEGFAGGSGASGGGAGGGAGGVGSSGAVSGDAVGNPGGIGAISSITGTSTYYAGGGGSGGRSDPGNQRLGGAGGLGGGGNGGSTTNSPPVTSGTASTGGGGGAPGTLAGVSVAAGNGGSGVVIVRYKAD